MLKPLDILKTAVTASSPRLMDDFYNVIKSIYRYKLFKPLMDLSTTLVKQNRLKFIAQPKEFFSFEEGNCVTIEGGTFDKLANIFKSRKSYKITLKKITPEVLIHEIGHMIEKELALNLNETFMKIVYQDLSNKYSNNVSLNSAIKQVMVEEVKLYTIDHQSSELFTRYYQILAMSKEVLGYSASYGYKIENVYEAFPNINTWIKKFLSPLIISKIDPQIASVSRDYIVSIDSIKQMWSQQKIKPIHTPQSVNGKKWSNVIKSIDE